MCVLNISTILIVRYNYIHCPYLSHGRKLCLVPILCGAGIAQVNILLHILMGKIDVIRCLAQVRRA